MIRAHPGLILCALFPMLVSCDPGYRLPPVAWTCSPTGLWSTKYPNSHLDYSEAGGLIGESWLHLKYQLRGNGRAVRLDSATMKTAVGLLHPDATFRPQEIPVGGGAFQVWWEFGRDRPAFQVLRDTSVVILYFRSASGSEPITIRYVWSTDLDQRCQSPAA